MQSIVLLLSIISFQIYNVNGRVLNVYGFTQAYYRYHGRDDNTFALRRTRLIFKVKEGKSLEFKMQMDFLKNPALLDAYMNYKNRGFVIKIGRFLPDFTFYMPHSSTALDFVDYPLIAKNYGMWRQVGIEVSYFLTDCMYAKSGVFNGPKNSYKDIDGMKDVLFKLGYSKKWVNAGLYAYQRKEIGKQERLAGLYIDLRPKRYIFTMEPLLVFSDSAAIKRKDAGYYVQAGMYILEGLKTLLRYEELYVNMESDGPLQRRMWLGLVREFSHFKLYVNYIKGLRGDETEDFVLQLQCKW